MNKRSILVARILMILYIVAVAFLCFGHLDKIPKVSRTIFGLEMDKVIHFLMFLPFPILSYFAIGKNPSGPWKALGEVMLVFLAGCVIATGTELVQALLPYRSADPKDFLADAIALALASLSVFVIMLVKGIRSSRAQ